MTLELDETETGWDRNWMRPELYDTGTGWGQNWMRPELDETKTGWDWNCMTLELDEARTGWDRNWMKPKLDETGTVWHWNWMRPELDETGTGWNWNWTRLKLDETETGWDRDRCLVLIPSMSLYKFGTNMIFRDSHGIKFAHLMQYMQYYMYMYIKKNKVQFSQQFQRHAVWKLDNSKNYFTVNFIISKSILYYNNFHL